MEGGRAREEGAPGHRAVYAPPATAPDLGARGGNHVGTPCAPGWMPSSGIYVLGVRNDTISDSYRANP